MHIDDVVILVGGKGTRLGRITKKIPKPLIKIKNKSFLDHLISKLIKYNFCIVKKYIIIFIKEIFLFVRTK